MASLDAGCCSDNFQSLGHRNRPPVQRGGQIKISDYCESKIVSRHCQALSRRGERATSSRDKRVSSR